MRITFALLVSALLAFTVSSSPIETPTVRSTGGASGQSCHSPELYSAYPGGKGLSDNKFTKHARFSNNAKAAGQSPPPGYKTKFTDLHAASLVGPKDHYKTTFLSSYNYKQCAKLCDEEKDFQCKGFNIYYERDPKYQISKSDGSDCYYGGGKKQCCTNPVSLTNIKCVELSYVPTTDNAKNAGQYQSGFHIVIAGSDGFKKE